MKFETRLRLALLGGGAVFAAQGLLLTGGAEVSHATAHAAFLWGYVLIAYALVLVRRTSRQELGDLGTVGVGLALAAAGFAVAVVLPVLIAEGLLGGTTPSALHASLEAGTFLVYPALLTTGAALVRHPPLRLLGALLLAGTVLDAVAAPWAFGVSAIVALLLVRVPAASECRPGVLNAARTGG